MGEVHTEKINYKSNCKTDKYKRIELKKKITWQEKIIIAMCESIPRFQKN
jgi:hypothetical protein